MARYIAGGINIETEMTVEQWLGEDNKLGIDIWNNKYRRDEETFEQWLDRVSGGNKDVRRLIIQKKFLPGGRILSNRGITGEKASLSNCYLVTPPEDSIESIYECRKKLARTYSYGGGCGIDISKLAPAGAKVRNQAKKTTGAVSFMQGFSQTTEEIGQNGRRGALMISLSCTHPDLLEFIKCKMDVNAVTKANISVRVTDAFMEAARDGKPWTLSFTRDETGETVEKTVNAADVLELLCYANWDYAEPGMLFWDRTEQWNMLSNNPDFKYAGVNPCAEECLPAGGSCLLGSINLSEFVHNGEFDFIDFIDAVVIATECLNDILEEGLPLHPLEEQRESVANWRQIGLGIMGLADMLIKLGIRYGSPESIELCGRIARAMLNNAVQTSALLAKERGTYPKYTKAVLDTPFFKANIDPSVRMLVEMYGLRNSQLLTIAPTGTLSTKLRCSGGLEPIFANSYTRKTESLHGKDVYYTVYTPIVEQYMKEHNLKDESELPDYFVTASTVPYEERIAMQSIWQSYIDASISSTINLPNTATVEDVKNIYLLAWKSGLKGVTVFRDGCKRAGILTTHKEEDKPIVRPHLRRGDIIQCDDQLVGKKRKLITGCGTAHCEAWGDPETGDILETFVAKGSTGGCRCNQDAVSRLASLALRGGIPLESVVDQLMSCGGCDSYRARTVTKHDTSKGSSCPTAIGYALLDMAKEFTDEFAEEEEHDESQPEAQAHIEDPAITTGVFCPECGGEMRKEGGCDICPQCGYSHCG